MPITLNSEPLLLGLDLGTTNIKALLVTPNGRRVAEGAAPVPVVHGPGGLVEQDLDQIWRATVTAIRQAGAAAQRRRVAAVGVSSQGGALQPLDAAGRPLGRVISWMDGRGRTDDHRLTARLGPDWFARRIGHGESAVAIGQVLRLRREKRTRWAAIGFVGDQIVARLTGQAAHDATSLAIAMLYNPWRQSADPDVLAELGLREEQLPRLLPARTPAGGLLRSAARLTDLPAGIPVSVAVHDQYAAALGCGAVRPGDWMLGTGTAWVLLGTTRSLRPPVIPQAYACRHVVDGRGGQLLTLVNGGSAVNWVLELTGLRGEWDELLASVPPGSDGVRVRPLLVTAGSALWPPGSRGQITGLTLGHTARHVLRATVEGLACELERYLRVVRRAGVTTRRLVLTGAAAASRVTPQIVADVTGLPVHCAATSQTSALGAAVIGRALLEPQTDWETLSQTMTGRGRRLRPGPNRERYRRLAAEYGTTPPAETDPGNKR